MRYLARSKLKASIGSQSTQKSSCLARVTAHFLFFYLAGLSGAPVSQAAPVPPVSQPQALTRAQLLALPPAQFKAYLTRRLAAERVRSHWPHVSSALELPLGPHLEWFEGMEGLNVRHESGKVQLYRYRQQALLHEDVFQTGPKGWVRLSFEGAEAVIGPGTTVEVLLTSYLTSGGQRVHLAGLRLEKGWVRVLATPQARVLLQLPRGVAAELQGAEAVFEAGAASGAEVAMLSGHLKMAASVGALGKLQNAVKLNQNQRMVLKPSSSLSLLKPEALDVARVNAALANRFPRMAAIWAQVLAATRTGADQVAFHNLRALQKKATERVQQMKVAKGKSS